MIKNVLPYLRKFRGINSRIARSEEIIAAVSASIQNEPN